METQPNFRNSYLYEQLISYIGNKRKLIPFIEQVLLDRWGTQARGMSFLDLFAGSGVVSRLARTMGYRVISNDWESYACQINRCYLQHSPEDLNQLFLPWGGAEKLWESLNNLSDPTSEEEYIARYYSPRSIDPFQVEIGKERLFYTRRNGLILDRIRNRIDILFPPEDSCRENQSRRALILGPLLFQASKHTNTSGVFKAYHKGFGGYGKDALSRILKEIKLPLPCLWEDFQNHFVYQKDALQLVEELEPVDIAYFDPPYNQHQYGSNYHMLNTLVHWDKIPEPLEYNEKGVLKRKAGIRNDWQKTASPYCKKHLAGEAFRELMHKTQARQIIISYSTDGIIPMDEMRDICESKGRLTLLCNPYSVYKGGRQSNHRKHRNIEFLWIIESSKKNSRINRDKNEKQILLREIQMYTSSILSVKKIKNRKKESDGIYSITLGSHVVRFSIQGGCRLSSIEGEEALSIHEIIELKDLLDQARFETAEEEISFLFSLLKTTEDRNKSKLASYIIRILKKLAHPRTRKTFVYYYKKYVSLEEEEICLNQQKAKRQKLGRVAIMRMKGLELPDTHLN